MLVDYVDYVNFLIPFPFFVLQHFLYKVIQNICKRILVKKSQCLLVDKVWILVLKPHKKILETLDYPLISHKFHKLFFWEKI